MCDQILVRKDGAEHYCDNVGELRAALGGDVVVENGMLADDDCCLCPLDWPATAELHGMTARQATMEEGFPWPTFIIEPALHPYQEGRSE